MATEEKRECDRAEALPGPRKVAFIAMPFGMRPTGLAFGTGPVEVDFDALWGHSFLPALEELGYLPVRADNQKGSVIVKGMLEQLVHADLVVADISIPNGNVYYEAGVRHAARERGCVLVRADWSKPLFDLKQIRQILYPGLPESPTLASYESIREVLVSEIPPLANSVGPVHELATTLLRDTETSQALDEVASEVFEFRRRMRAAGIKAQGGDRSELRSLLADERVAKLPAHALHPLVIAAGDHLHWCEVVQFIGSLPKEVREADPFLLEQEAHALSKLGEHSDAVALLETIIEVHGETPDRLGTLGSRYRSMVRDEPSRMKRRRGLGSAIEAYRRGMQLDLNEYYCAHKLLVVLSERARPEDREEARMCAGVVRAALERARMLGRRDEWLRPAETVLAFYRGQGDEAARLVDSILDGDWSNWKLFSVAVDLEALVNARRQDLHSDDENGQLDMLRQALDDLRAGLPVEQARLHQDVMPVIKAEMQRYEKFQAIHARPAIAGEVIVSVTSDGEEETINRAAAGSFVVRNLTTAREEYLVAGNKFADRYTYSKDVDRTWKEYLPKGEVVAIEITRRLTRQLEVGEEFSIIAPWGTEQVAREGDMLVSPLPDLDEIYRIARKEFQQTYRLQAPSTEPPA